MTASESSGRILLLGASGVGKHRLLQSIRGQETVRQPDATYPWRLDNKYYTADVQFDVRHVDQCAELELESAGYEAVVIVFDAGRQASFDSVQRWYEAAGGGEAELGVQLAVGTREDGLPRSTKGEPAKPSWLVAAEKWCTEQLVEYVETWSTTERQQQPAQEAASSGQGSEGASGVQRIREALEAHMWPGLRLKPNPRHGVAAAAESLSQEASDAEVEEAEPAPATNGVRSGGSSSSPRAAQDLSFTDYLRDPDEAVAAAGIAGGQPTGGEGFGVEEMEQMEQLLAQITSEWSSSICLPQAALV